MPEGRSHGEVLDKQKRRRSRLVREGCLVIKIKIAYKALNLAKR